MNVPHTIVEDGHSTACEQEQAFALDLFSDRKLGGAFSFATYSFGRDDELTASDILASAPVAGANSGRVLTYRGCLSCAILPKADGINSLMGGEFGTSVAVGEFAPGEEQLAVGAPRLGGGGKVGVVADFARWNFYSAGGMVSGDRQCQCDWGNYWPYNENCSPWDATLQGSFGDDEQFGAALAVADLTCDGYDDLIVGAPGATLPTMNDAVIEAGAVYVYINSHDGFSGVAPSVLRQGTPEVGGEASAGERFGTALAVGNFNGARRLSNDLSCFDLVVGTPNEAGGAGQIQVFEGGPGGLLYGGPVLDLDDVFGAAADPGDQFGWAMIAGDLNKDDFDDLVIGAPGDDFGGSVVIIPGSDLGLDVANATRFRQGDGVAGDNVAGDQFGYALTWTNLGLGSDNAFRALAIGAPGEDGDIGAINVYRVGTGVMVSLTGDTYITQGLIEGDEMTGDRFGSSLLPPRAVTEEIFQ
ncbi:integrin alpha [Enhygromyxa salina]|uniref:integrin alpha n=1 Tax=Enhygromyxa salina TaxID=215803 RepID=UPI0006969BDE|nr:integrin alpha [Enhygromyxa salina]